MILNRNRRVTPDVEPGYLQHLIPNEAPVNGEDWDQVMRDVEEKIMPGVCLFFDFFKLLLILLF